MSNNIPYESTQTKRKKLEQYLNKDGIYVQHYRYQRSHHVSRNRFLVICLLLGLLLLGLAYAL